MRHLNTTLELCGFQPDECADGEMPAISPITGLEFARVKQTPLDEVPKMISKAKAAFEAWREIPAPRRGELVRLWGEELRKAKSEIGFIISNEVGKIAQEGLGEVQEAIDICDLAVGQSRQLFGKTIVSERARHRIVEQYHPLGTVAIITAFNFPCAVFAWNAAIALICGDPVIFKPSEKALLSGLATFKALQRAIARCGDFVPDGVAQIVLGGQRHGELLVDSPDVPLVSATGSTRMGRIIGPKVAARFGRRILELGGNNAMIVTPAADLALAARAILFSAVGTAGQRCTTLRRLIVHKSIKTKLLHSVVAAYEALPIGDPLEPGVLVGPLIDGAALLAMQEAIRQASAQGGEVLIGGERVTQHVAPGAHYVRPAIVDMPSQSPIVKCETFAPLLYVLTYEDLPDAIEILNDVPQGLSSCIFSNDMRETEFFLSAAGSDCGMANVNVGPSGAEIGGAFGGEKETGGDRESGSDAWKSYMRRTTNTINYSSALPLAQGVTFG